MLNRVVVMGRLTKDPELRKTNSDISFATFSVAVDNVAKEADGTRGTLFIDCRVFGSQAENITKYTRKGDKIGVDGSLNQRNFIRQDGTKGKVIEILADSVTFLEARKEHLEENQDGEKSPDAFDKSDDDLPFNGEETKPQEKVKPNKKAPQPKYDPYTGKPLTPKGKK